MPKTIWYINQHSGGPGIGPHYRAYELCLAWQEQGHKAHVFYGNYAHKGQDVPHAKFQYIDGVPFTAIQTLKYDSSGLRRLLSMLLFGWRVRFIPKNLAKADLKKDSSKPDAIIVSTVHPFGIFSAKKLAKKYKAKLIFEIRDFWPLTFYEILGMSKRHPMSLLCDFTERFALKNADLVTSVLPRAHLYFKDHNRPVKDFAWTPMGASALMLPKANSDDDFSDGHKAAVNFINEAHMKGRKVIIYAGAMGPPNNVELLLSALESGQASDMGDKFSLLMVGDGVLRERLEDKSSAFLDVDCLFTGMLTKAETQQLLGLSDIGYAGGNNLPNLYCYGIAFNKLCSYLDAKLPTILPLEPCGDPISESGCGIVDGTSDPDIMWSHIEKLATMDAKELALMGEKGYKHLHKFHDYERIARDYVSAIFGPEHTS